MPFAPLTVPLLKPRRPDPVEERLARIEAAIARIETLLGSPPDELVEQLRHAEKLLGGRPD